VIIVGNVNILWLLHRFCLNRSCCASNYYTGCCVCVALVAVRGLFFLGCFYTGCNCSGCSCSVAITLAVGFGYCCSVAVPRFVLGLVDLSAAVTLVVVAIVMVILSCCLSVVVTLVVTCCSGCSCSVAVTLAVVSLIAVDQLLLNWLLLQGGQYDGCCCFCYCYTGCCCSPAVSRLAGIGVVAVAEGVLCAGLLDHDRGPPASLRYPLLNQAHRELFTLHKYI
jgi:hypothetical protein